MATKTNITELRTRVTEADQAKAYRDLETDIHDLHRMTIIVRKVVDATLDNRENRIDPTAIEQLAYLKDHLVVALDTDESDALFYALRRIEDMARDLDDKFQKGATLPVTGACNG